jgi:hypothetical protein
MCKRDDNDSSSELGTDSKYKSIRIDIILFNFFLLFSFKFQKPIGISSIHAILTNQSIL